MVLSKVKTDRAKLLHFLNILLSFSSFSQYSANQLNITFVFMQPYNLMQMKNKVSNNINIYFGLNEAVLSRTCIVPINGKNVHCSFQKCPCGNI